MSPLLSFLKTLSGNYFSLIIAQMTFLRHQYSIHCRSGTDALSHEMSVAVQSDDRRLYHKLYKTQTFIYKNINGQIDTAFLVREID